MTDRPHRKGTQTDDRAVSVAVTHALTVAITTVLVSGLLIASGGLLDSQEQNVGGNQLEEIGSDATSYIHTLDRMNQQANGATLSVEPAYPRQVVGSYNYRVELREEGETAVLEVSAVRLDAVATYELDLETAVENSSATGSTLQISLCDDGDGEIRLGECS